MVSLSLLVLRPYFGAKPRGGEGHKREPQSRELCAARLRRFGRRRDWRDRICKWDSLARSDMFWIFYLQSLGISPGARREHCIDFGGHIALTLKEGCKCEGIPVLNIKFNIPPFLAGIFSLKHESSIFRSFIQPCMWFWKCQASSPWDKQYKA